MSEQFAVQQQLPVQSLVHLTRFDRVGDLGGSGVAGCCGHDVEQTAFVHCFEHLAVCFRCCADGENCDDFHVGLDGCCLDALNVALDGCCLGAIHCVALGDCHDAQNVVLDGCLDVIHDDLDGCLNVALGAVHGDLDVKVVALLHELDVIEHLVHVLLCACLDASCCDVFLHVQLFLSCHVIVYVQQMKVQDKHYYRQLLQMQHH